MLFDDPTWEVISARAIVRRLASEPGLLPYTVVANAHEAANAAAGETALPVRDSRTDILATFRDSQEICSVTTRNLGCRGRGRDDQACLIRLRLPFKPQPADQLGRSLRSCLRSSLVS